MSNLDEESSETWEIFQVHIVNKIRLRLMMKTNTRPQTKYVVKRNHTKKKKRQYANTAYEK